MFSRFRNGYITKYRTAVEIGSVSVPTNIVQFGQELIIDGDMEDSGVANWDNVGTPTVKAKSTALAYDGDQSLRIETNADEGVKQTVLTIPGKTYKVSARVLWDAGSVGLPSIYLDNTAKQTVGAASWELLSFTFTASATTHNIGFKGNSSWFNVDAVTMRSI